MAPLLHSVVCVNRYVVLAAGLTLLLVVVGYMLKADVWA